MNIDQLFFELLQVAVGTRKSLSCQPFEKELVALYELSKKQALTAIAFAGLSKYLDSLGEASPELGTPLSRGDGGVQGVRGSLTYLKWLGLTAKVAQRNREVTVACVELVRQYAHDGIQCCILKGQGNLEYYPEDLRECRNPGDIDVWCKTINPTGIEIAVSDLDGKGAHYERYHGKQAVVEYVKMLHRVAGTEPREGVRYHHTDAPSVNGVEVEAHFRPLFLDSPLRNCRLQRWFKENEQFGVHDTKIGEYVIPTPAASFNTVYQLAHIYRHLFDEGIGLRQLLDYYFVLRALHIEQGELADRTESMTQWAEGMGIAVKSNEEIMHTLGRFGMRKFAAATMYVIAKVFANDDDTANAYDNDNFCLNDWQKRWPWMICGPDEKEGKFLLNEIMQAGNFGKYDDRIKHDYRLGVRGYRLELPKGMVHAIEKTKHNLRLLSHYPDEVLWEPFFRLYHYLWRKLRLWRF